MIHSNQRTPFLAYRRFQIGKEAEEQEAVEEWKHDRDAQARRRIADDSVKALPVVVLHNFGGKKDVLLTVLSTWAAALVENKASLS